ncbi:hypothetical protein DFH29DRAFT_920494 [Suillus ampliporus]|nr:hypothetical protein DFH29DRAFT_920494 [Suillus ampliporus]
MEATHSPVNVNCPAHIHRLPIELLQHVFLLIVNDVPDCPSIFSYGDITISANVDCPPLVFTRVCQLWRVVAHSTTVIWSHFQVSLPGRVEPLKPFLPSLLQSWLALSGSQPLTLHIISGELPVRIPHNRSRAQPCYESSGADSQLLEILLSETERWETVTLSSSIEDWSCNLYTPQLRSLQCRWSELNCFDAPNLSHLHITHRWPLSVGFRPTPTCNNVRHLRLASCSVHVIRSSLTIFPHMETLRVDIILSTPITPAGSITHPHLQSITVPFSWSPYQCELTKMFRGLHLPMLRKLTLIAEPNEWEVTYIMEALASASCDVQALDFVSTIPLSEVDVDIVEPLFSVVREVTVHGELLRHPVI